MEDFIFFPVDVVSGECFMESTSAVDLEPTSQEGFHGHEFSQMKRLCLL